MALEDVYSDDMTDQTSRFELEQSSNGRNINQFSFKLKEASVFDDYH